ncbi:MAG TPA: hypothetical protein VLY03_05105 [Bacteroidota bacterium]|nr:hypothetical protein [Bacteroidota bacterium]
MNSFENTVHLRLLYFQKLVEYTTKERRMLRMKSAYGDHRHSHFGRLDSTAPSSYVEAALHIP